MSVVGSAMAIFSSSDVSVAFDAIVPLIPEVEAKQLLGRLSSTTPKTIFSAEWETLVINALRSCGAVEIEPSLRSHSGRVRRPDVVLRPAVNGPLALLSPCYIEISAISDDGYEQAN